MRLTIVNISKSILPPMFHVTVAAIRHQVNEDFTPSWGIAATLRGATSHAYNHHVRLEGHHDAIIYVGDSSLDPNTGIANATGYHSANHGNVPFGFVYLDVCEFYGEDWSTTLSHEVLELLADPPAVLAVVGPDPKDSARQVYRDLEVCDPVQGDSYDVDGVVVSNFVTKAYFGIGGGRTNFLDLPLEPFGVRPGGYFQYEDIKTGEVGQVDGSRARERANRIADGRKRMGMARRNARRQARFA